MFTYMASTVIREKESFRAIQLRLLAYRSSQIMDMSAYNTCEKSVKDRISIKCNLCLRKVHLKCNYLNYVDPQYIKFSNKTWHRYNCNKYLFPFTTINNFKLHPLLIDRTYCNSDQLQTLKEFTDKSSLSLFHMNTCSLSKNMILNTLFSQQRLILIL